MANHRGRLTTMKKTRASAAAAALIAIAGLSYAGLSGATATMAAKAPPEVALPVTVDDFRLSDQNLHSHELRQLGDASAVVLITQENNCPVSRNISADSKGACRKNTPPRASRFSC